MEKGLLRLICVFTLMSGAFLSGKSQAFTEIYSIFQANCTNSTCHNGSQPTIDFSGSQSAVFNALKNGTPINPTAAGKGNKLIDPGHPYNSFLLRKVGADFDGYFNLQVAEGDRMPSNGAPALGDYEIELIRQWILAGAEQNTVVDTAILHDYYTNGGIHFITPPPAPPADSGFQVRMGPIFIERAQPGNTDEIEYLKKEHLVFDQDKEVYKIQGLMNNQSHHFLLFMFDDSTGAAQEPEGLRIVNVLNNATDGDKELQAAWQFSETFTLPEGTAFFYEDKDWYDLNYHVKNYSYDSILPVDFYLNVWTEDRGTGAREMKARLVNNQNLWLWPGSNSDTYSEGWGGPGRNIWMMSSHTHKFGTDFDIYKGQPGGGLGDQVYEGFYNSTYQFNQGYYDWEHPAVRVFDTLLHVSGDEGLVMKTKWDVTQSSPVFFGLTTDDEMQLMTYLYVDDEPAIGIDDALEHIAGMWVSPNPMHSRGKIRFDLDAADEVKFEITDVVGKSRTLVRNQYYPAGSHELDFETEGFESGIYFIRLKTNKGEIVRKIVVME